MELNIERIEVPLLIAAVAAMVARSTTSGRTQSVAR